MGIQIVLFTSILELGSDTIERGVKQERVRFGGEHGLERSNRIPFFMVEEDGTSVLDGIHEGTEVGDEQVSF